MNRTRARHRWPSEDLIGKRVPFHHGQTWITIEYGVQRAIADEIYVPPRQSGYASNLVFRTSIDPMSASPSIRAAVHAVDPQLGVYCVETIESLQQESIAAPRVTATLLGLSAILALISSASGIAAVIALTVSQRASCRAGFSTGGYQQQREDWK